MAAPATVTLRIRGPIARDDLPGLCERACAVLGENNGRIVLCDVEGVAADAVAVDALCRLQAGARRNRCQVRLRGASEELIALIGFMGLTEVLAHPAELTHADRPVDRTALP